MNVKQPLYVLPHGIVVISEYPPNAACPYWRVRIRPHPFFPNAKVLANGIYMRRNRVVLTAKLGRALDPMEIAHHRNEDKADDSMDNVELLSIRQHNHEHKAGSRHRPESKAKTSASLKKAYAQGMRSPPLIQKRDARGRIAS